uniref:Uncharacterized protein n=1 Tax=Zonotrichia albicollis TaxID=44394 RepID=A0A8D2M8E5_ZONAL
MFCFHQHCRKTDKSCCTHLFKDLFPCLCFSTTVSATCPSAFPIQPCSHQHHPISREKGKIKLDNCEKTLNLNLTSSIITLIIYLRHLDNAKSSHSGKQVRYKKRYKGKESIFYFKPG